MHADTLDAKNVTSKRGNKHAQIFATQFGWHRGFPLKAKSEAHEAVSVLLARGGLPNAMVMDGAKGSRHWVTSGRSAARQAAM